MLLIFRGKKVGKDGGVVLRVFFFLVVVMSMFIVVENLRGVRFCEK